MSLFGFSRHIAVFVDDRGDFVGKKVFKFSFTSAIGLKKKTFEYQKGFYNIKPQITRFDISFKTAVFFNDYVYVYNVNNPDPISFSNNWGKPIMDPEIYKIRLKSKLVEDLNKAGLGGPDWGSILKWGIIIILGCAIAYYLLSGGSLFGTPEQEIINQTTQNVSSLRGANYG